MRIIPTWNLVPPRRRRRVVVVILAFVLVVAMQPQQPQRLVHVDAATLNQSHHYDRYSTSRDPTRPVPHHRPQSPPPRQQTRLAWTKETYPNPIRHPVQCRGSNCTGSSNNGTNENHRICDPDGLLSIPERQALETKISSWSRDIYTMVTPTLEPVQIQIYIAFVGKVGHIIIHTDWLIDFHCTYALFVHWLIMFIIFSALVQTLDGMEN